MKKIVTVVIHIGYWMMYCFLLFFCLVIVTRGKLRLLTSAV
ncbi:hypothetical protein [Chitinophaga oryzae]|nr:hypothetical protein [Chitinophaga oryzae]